VATAEMTGVIALLLSANARLSVDSVVSVLKETTAASGEAPGLRSVDAGAAVSRLYTERGSGRMASARSAR